VAFERDVFVSRLHSSSRTVILLSAEFDGSLAAALPARNAVAITYFYVIRILGATGKTLFQSYYTLRVFCTAVIAVNARESSGIFATMQLSEANMFRCKQLRGKVSEC